jgi:rubredoxin
MSEKSATEGGEKYALILRPILLPPPGLSRKMADTPYKTYMCLICGFIYDEAAGLPEEGIPPGTRWEDVPPNWTCPECQARKEDFELVEI